MKNNVLNLLGLAYRASKIVIGSDDVILNMKENKIYLVFLDKDLSSNIEKQIIKNCDLNSVKLDRSFTKEELSHAIGKKNVCVIGITDEGFTKLINKSL